MKLALIVIDTRFFTRERLFEIHCSQPKILDELLTNLYADMESKYLYKLATLER